MRAALIILTMAIASTGCAHYRPIPVGNSATEIVIAIGISAMVAAVEEQKEDGVWCDDDIVDPPHTCPVKRPEP